MPAPIIHVWSWTDGAAAAVTASWTSVLLRDSLRNAQIFLVGGLMFLRRALFTLTLLVLAPLAAGAQTKTTITGNIQDVTGIAATSGTIEFKIKPSSSSILYFVSGAGVIAPQTASCGIDGSGDIKNLALTGACEIWGNDLISPGNTTYDVAFLPNGTRTNRIRSLLISGSSYNLANPVFAPNVRLSPQRTTIRAARIQSNLTPAADGVFNLGADDKRYSAAYLDSLFVNNNFTFSGTRTDSGNINFTGTATQFDNTIYASGQAGVDAGVKMVACLAIVSSTGGRCNARGLEGAQTIAATVAIPANVVLLLGAAQYTSSVSPAFSFANNSALIGLGVGGVAGEGTIIKGDNLTGPILAPTTPAANTTRIYIAHMTLDNQDKANVGGIGISLENSLAAEVVRVHIRKVETGIDIKGSGGFSALYNRLFDVSGFDLVTGIQLGTNANDNTFYSPRMASIATGYKLDAGRGNTFYSPNCETSTSECFDVNVGGNFFYNPYVENGVNGFDIADVGGTVVIGGTLISLSGTDYVFAGTSDVKSLILTPTVNGQFNSAGKLGAKQFRFGKDTKDFLQQDPAYTADKVSLRNAGDTDYEDFNVLGLRLHSNDGGGKVVLRSGTPASTIDVLIDGGRTTGVVTAWNTFTSTGGTQSLADTTILGDATAGPITVALQAISTMDAGRMLIIKKTDSSANTVTVDANGAQTIDGSLTVVLANQHDFVWLMNDGSNWIILSQGLAIDDPLEGTLTNTPRWIFKQVDHTDMTAAATADTFTLWTLPANTMIHDVVGTVVTPWEAVVGLSTAVCSVGTQAGAANDLTLDDDFFAAATVYELHDATASGGKGSKLFDATDKFAPFMLVASGDIEIQCDLTGDDHADTNAGQARIYILVSQPLSNTTVEAN